MPSVQCAAMFIKPSDLPWWAWLGGALVFSVVGRFAFVGFTAGGGILLLLLMIASGLVAIGCAFVGIIRFVRWAWG
jgi:hypothetical protein